MRTDLSPQNSYIYMGKSILCASNIHDCSFVNEDNKQIFAKTVQRVNVLHEKINNFLVIGDLKSKSSARG